MYRIHVVFHGKGHLSNGIITDYNDDDDYDCDGNNDDNDDDLVLAIMV